MGRVQLVSAIAGLKISGHLRYATRCQYQGKGKACQAAARQARRTADPERRRGGGVAMVQTAEERKQSQAVSMKKYFQSAKGKAALKRAKDKYLQKPEVQEAYRAHARRYMAAKYATPEGRAIAIATSARWYARHRAARSD